MKQAQPSNSSPVLQRLPVKTVQGICDKAFVSAVRPCDKLDITSLYTVINLTLELLQSPHFFPSSNPFTQRLTETLPEFKTKNLTRAVFLMLMKFLDCISKF